MRHRAQLAAVTAGPLVRVRGPFMIMIIIIGPLYRPLYSKMCVCVSVCETACLSVCPLQATGHRGLLNHVCSDSKNANFQDDAVTCSSRFGASSPRTALRLLRTQSHLMCIRALAARFSGSTKQRCTSCVGAVT
jgi:hypothetical protein